MRAPKVRTLFLDVMGNALAGHEDLLTEVKIGHRVFGRPSDYQASDDTIVRAQMRLLRGKLEGYFADEGRDEPVIITIPKGGYVPKFEPRGGQTAPSASVETPSVPPHKRPLMLWLAPLALSAAFAAGWLASKQPVPVAVEAKATSHPILSRVFDHSRPSLAVIQDVSLILINNSLRTDFTPEEIQSGSYKKRLEDPALEPEQARLLHFIDERQYTTVADLNMTRYLTRMMADFSDQIQVVYPRHLHMRRFKESNAILIGGSIANPWARLFENRLKFRLVREDLKVRSLSVKNIEPRPGEQAMYRPGEYVYSILALLPGLGGDGTVLIMAGTSTEGTEAAAELAMRPASARNLVERLNRETGAKGFTSFQAIVRSARVGGTSAAADILALRVE